MISFRPVEYNVVVEPDPTEEVTKGGIILPNTQTERDELSMDEGLLVAASPHAFSYADWPAGDQPQVGQRVVFAKYAGALRKIDGRQCRVIKDKDIIGVIENGQ